MVDPLLRPQASAMQGCPTCRDGSKADLEARDPSLVRHRSCFIAEPVKPSSFHLTKEKKKKRPPDALHSPHSSSILTSWIDTAPTPRGQYQSPVAAHPQNATQSPLDLLDPTALSLARLAEMAADQDPALRWANLAMVSLLVNTIAIPITGVAVEALEVEGEVLLIAPLLTMAQAVGTIILITEAATGTTMGAEVEEATITHIDPHLHRHDLDMQVQHLQALLDLLVDRLLLDTLRHTMDRRLHHISRPPPTINFAFLMRTLLRHQLGGLSLLSCRLQSLQDLWLRDREEHHLQGRQQH